MYFFSAVKNRFFLIILVALALAMVASIPVVTLAANSCRAIFNPKKSKGNLPESLTSYRETEIRNISTRTIHNLNVEELRSLEATIPKKTSARAQAIYFSQAFDVLEALRHHPIAAPEQTSRYQPEDVEIGYCFGRAMWEHLILLKMGVQKESIRKIWAIGPMTSREGAKWGLHVVTAVYTDGFGWVTLDTNAAKPEPIRYWFSNYESRSKDKRVRIYVTDASKFGADLGVYDRIQMGLDLDRSQDWFRGYFTDLMQSIAKTDLATLGLVRIPRTEGWSPDQVTPTRAPLKTIFGLNWDLF